jgi:hypothetical protein
MPNPSARRVATALTQRGRPVHFSTIARWRLQGWRVVEFRSHPLLVASADLDAAAPVLTGKPSEEATGLLEQSDLRIELQELTDAQLLARAVREMCISSIVLNKEMQRQAAMLIRSNPKEVAVLSLALARCSEAAALVLTPSDSETENAQRLNETGIKPHPLAESIKAWGAARAASRSER